MDQLTGILIGMITGSFLVAVIWVGAALVRGRGARKLRALNDEIVKAVLDKINDLDSLRFMYRRGKIGAEAFVDSLEEKIESIDALYKPSLHKLDAYFVKYVEKLLDECRQQRDAAAERLAGEKNGQPASATIAPPASIEQPPPEPSEPAEEPVQPVDPGKKPEPEEATAPIGQSPAVPEQPAETPETPSATTDTEESVIEAMEADAAEESVFPIETYLELETDTDRTSGNAEPAAISVDLPPELELQQEEKFTFAEETSISTPPRAPAEPVPEPVKEATIEKQDEYVEPVAETQTPAEESEPASQGELPDTVVINPPVHNAGDTAPVQQPTVFEEPAVEQSIDDELPIFEPPVTSIEPSPSDIEAETIVQDRGGALPRAGEENKELGITGDDVMDTLDNMFGFKK